MSRQCFQRKGIRSSRTGSSSPTRTKQKSLESSTRTPLVPSALTVEQVKLALSQDRSKWHLMITASEEEGSSSRLLFLSSIPVGQMTFQGLPDSMQHYFGHLFPIKQSSAKKKLSSLIILQSRIASSQPKRKRVCGTKEATKLEMLSPRSTVRAGRSTGQAGR